MPFFLPLSLLCGFAFLTFPPSPLQLAPLLSVARVILSQPLTSCVGYTPLLMAGTEGYTTCCRKLLDAGADVNHRSHVLPSRFKSSKFYKTLSRSLLQICTQSDNATAIFHCANKNRVDVVRLLLERGANPFDTRNDKNETIEEIARQEGRMEMANLLHGWAATMDEPSERVKVCLFFTSFQAFKCLYTCCEALIYTIPVTQYSHRPW